MASKAGLKTSASLRRLRHDSLTAGVIFPYPATRERLPAKPTPHRKKPHRPTRSRSMCRYRVRSRRLMKRHAIEIWTGLLGVAIALQQSPIARRSTGSHRWDRPSAIRNLDLTPLREALTTRRPRHGAMERTVIAARFCTSQAKNKGQ